MNWIEFQLLLFVNIFLTDIQVFFWSDINCVFFWDQLCFFWHIQNASFWQGILLYDGDKKQKKKKQADILFLFIFISHGFNAFSIFCSFAFIFWILVCNHCFNSSALPLFAISITVNLSFQKKSQLYRPLSWPLSQPLSQTTISNRKSQIYDL